jgi:hypothetical protein
MDMKYRFLVVGALGVMLLANQASAEMREFKLPDGRTIKAEVVSFNGKLGKVQLRLENGVLKKVKPEIFVEEDQHFIKEWATVKAFMNETFFKLSCQKDLVKKWKDTLVSNVRYSGGNVEKETIGELKFEKFAYKLLLDNRNNVPLENVTIKYCIFCEEKGKGQWKKGTGWLNAETKGTINIDKLLAKSKRTVVTSPVVVGRQEITGDIVSSGTESTYEKISAEMEGIWVRVTIKMPSGQTATREVFEPESLEGKYSWPN